MELAEEPGGLVERVAALDIGKATVMACVRVPHEDQRRRCQEVREYGTTTGALLTLAGHLHRHGVTLVVMEATSDYWKPVFYLLEAEGFTCWLLNARHVKNVPGRPKTDKLDAVWLAKVAERGMCRPSLVHPRPIRELRDLTRYRRSLIRERTAEKQRVEKLLEDAQIKLSSVASNIFGVSGRQMLAAMLAGQRDPQILAGMAHGRMRRKIPQLQEALTGQFTGHHAFLCQMMVDRIDDLTARIGQVTARIEEQIAPYARAVEQLDEITGVGEISAQELIAELGPDMTRFPTAGHLASWARFAPVSRSSAGKAKGASAGKGNPWLAATLGEIVTAASRTDTFLGERYHRIARRRGKRRAMVATGNSVLVIIWNVLSDPDARYHDLGPGF
jgi:transposase